MNSDTYSTLVKMANEVIEMSNRLGEIQTFFDDHAEELEFLHGGLSAEPAQTLLDDLACDMQLSSDNA